MNLNSRKKFSLFQEIVVDNFAGGGGASTGISIAIGRSVDVAINHDPAAIAMHKVNHPDTEHYCESVWDIDPLTVTGGRPVALCWFSPDCKHFSKAKGGKPVEKKIRGLAWVTVKWAVVVRPRVIMLENVEEFKTWGPLDGDGYPIAERKGETFQAFVDALSTGIKDPNHPAWQEIDESLGMVFSKEQLMKGLGYEVEWQELRACDYGAPTMRKRLSLIARRDGQPIVWPKPTHGDPKTLAVISGKLKPWRTAAEIIDWSLPCPSIFERKRPLADNTMRRIARGIKKFVIDNPEPFIVPIGYGERKGQAPRVNSIKQPLSTIVSSCKQYLITPTLMVNTTGHPGSSVDEPLKTITTGGHHALIAPTLIQYHGEQSGAEVRGQALKKPLMVVDASPRYALVASFLAKHYGGNYTGPGAGLKEPVPTVTTVDHNALVTSHLVKMKGTNIGQPVTKPLQTITAGGLHFGEVRAFMLKYYGTGGGQSLDEPMHTITTKDRFGLVTIHGQDYQIVDIGMRMLEPRELFNAQGFPADYIIDKDCNGKQYPKSAQVARCGNAVPPPFAEALVRANLPELCEMANDIAVAR